MNNSENKPYGRPHKILVTNFEFDATLTGSIRFLIRNPTTYKPLRIKLTMYGSADKTEGHFESKKVFGEALIENAYN